MSCEFGRSCCCMRLWKWVETMMLGQDSPLASQCCNVAVRRERPSTCIGWWSGLSTHPCLKKKDTVAANRGSSFSKLIQQNQRGCSAVVHCIGDLSTRRDVEGVARGNGPGGEQDVNASVECTINHHSYCVHQHLNYPLFKIYRYPQCEDYR